MSPRFRMALTAELVEKRRRTISDSGPEPGLAYLDDQDYQQLIEATLASRPHEVPLWVFAYGSLIWKPEFEHVEEVLASASGWHRCFCINMTRWRGTLEQPGLMLGLDRGGLCKGVAYRLPDTDIRVLLATLFRREMTAKPPTYRPHWLKLSTASGPLRALGFVANPKGRTYVGKLDDATVALVLARACGHLGSGAEYLFNTVANLESRGIHDRHLWRLQKLVAAEISAIDQAAESPDGRAA